MDRRAGCVMEQKALPLPITEEELRAAFQRTSLACRFQVALERPAVLAGLMGMARAQRAARSRMSMSIRGARSRMR